MDTYVPKSGILGCWFWDLNMTIGSSLQSLTLEHKTSPILGLGNTLDVLFRLRVYGWKKKERKAMLKIGWNTEMS